MDNSLVKNTLREIDRGYHSGTLAWLKRSRNQDWNRMIALEDKINQAILTNNRDSLVLVLRKYKNLIIDAVEDFRDFQNETHNLFEQRI